MLSDYFPQISAYLPNAYLRALVILILAFVVIRILIFIIEKVIIKFTKKTKTDVDDLIIEKSSKPITALAFFIGLRFALVEVPIPENFLNILLNIIMSLIILTISWWAYGITDLLIFYGWKKIAKKTKTDVDDSLVNLVHGLLKAIWIVFTLLYILNLWGIEIGPFLAGLGIGGLAVAFAMQESLANIFGGVSIILDKTVKVGDLVYLDDGTKGKVLHIGLRSTRIKTFDNEIVIIPNGKFANSKIQNVSLPEPKARVVIPFGVAYGSNIEKVKKIVLNEIKKIKNVVDEPAPSVMFLEMADSSLNFKAYFYVDSFENRFASIDEANTKIYNALNKAKIEIPFPQIDVHLKKK